MGDGGGPKFVESRKLLEALWFYHTLIAKMAVNLVGLVVQECNTFSFRGIYFVQVKLYNLS